MSDENKITVKYALDNQDTTYAQYLENVMGILHYHFANSKLCVVDCLDTENNTTVPVIAAMLEKDGETAVLPLAQIFDMEENTSTRFIPALFKDQAIEAV